MLTCHVQDGGPYPAELWQLRLPRASFRSLRTRVATAGDRRQHRSGGQPLSRVRRGGEQRSRPVKPPPVARPLVCKGSSLRPGSRHPRSLLKNVFADPFSTPGRPRVPTGPLRLHRLAGCDPRHTAGRCHEFPRQIRVSSARTGPGQPPERPSRRPFAASEQRSPGEGDVPSNHVP